MKSTLLALAAAGMLAGSAVAQTTNTQTTGPGSTTGMSTSPNLSSTASTPPATHNQSPGSTAAASGNDNQAVATTNADSPQPAQGHNSFTRRQARGRIAKQGFTQVAGLKKDQSGVWRGMAMKSGTKVPVWLDYKGNVGQGS